jgi:hypothetical protein
LAIDFFAVEFGELNLAHTLLWSLEGRNVLTLDPNGQAGVRAD